MPADQYFSADPTSEAHWRPLRVSLAGHDLTLTTASGVFAADALDRGTRVLLEAVPEPPRTGRFLDVGCGWGPIALSLALQSPEAQVTAVDVNARSREACTRNAALAGCPNVTVCAPEEVPAEARFDVIWSNPPIRIGKAQLHELLSLWLGRLTPTGEAWLVVGKQLGADSLLRWIQEIPGVRAERAATSRGFRVLRVWRAPAAQG
ncbi:MAG: methyltransferase [Microbacteriaceae bacterium]|jgi:16S rRNA G1207 methylase RsmC|nr:methyltransferase [Microbacteriaceae bacterium]MCI1207055.1 methyltransferase [Microbacteriaceae bacterium]